ncbi:hypothetical protein GBAR_LOCUS18094 [Geodia barretti]|uniref:Uncharacterized protein n=1 Tax=Geodia barretti TaxID=519541 RepID=A0AA35SMT1_GEOBA|nr:hypothetical protein GBAR_LOCUS18094 [Geodia barretti]
MCFCSCSLLARVSEIVPFNNSVYSGQILLLQLCAIDQIKKVA